MRRSTALSFLFVLSTFILSAAVYCGQAHAYVSSKTDDGKYAFYWKESCVPVTIYLNAFDVSSGLTAEQIVKSVTEAAHAWSADTVSCTSGGVTTSPSFEIVPTLAAEGAAPPHIAWDAHNVITFRTESWSKSGIPGHDYPFEALAVTTVTARLDGHIVDADMEINGVSKSWMNLDPGYSVPFDHGAVHDVFDLQNALTHEFGHFIGLDHTCYIPSATNPAVSDTGKARPNDDQGNPVPDCDGAPSKISSTVMFNSAVPQETSKRVLSDDDKNAVCGIYPASRDTVGCALDSASPGCAVAAERPRPGRRRPLGLALGLGALGLLGLIALGRRARRA